MTIETAETKGRNPLLMVGLGLGTAALIGGGAFAATQLAGGGGEQPADVLPASSIMYARIDVDPAASQKVAAVRFMSGLDDDAKAALDRGELKKWAWDQMVDSAGRAPAGLDFDKDIEPWLGDRLGVSAVAKAEGEDPAVVMAVQVKDQAKAEETLTKLAADPEVQRETPEGEKPAWFFQGDYAIITTETDLELVKGEVAKGSLADDEEFSSDMADLGDAGIASAWADLEASSALARTGMDATGLDPASAMGAYTGLDQEQLAQGRVAMAAVLSPDAIEVHGVTRGAEPLQVSDGGTQRLALSLPSDTLVAMSIEHGSDYVKGAWDLYAQQVPDEIAQLQSEAKQQGYTLPDDLQTILGSSAVLSAGPELITAIESGSESTSVPQLPVAFRSATDTSRMQTLLGDGLQAAGLADMDLVKHQVDGDIFSVAGSQDYLTAVTGGGDKLADSAQFKLAAPKAADADGLFYLDVNPLERFYLDEITDEKARAAVEQIAAVGITSDQTAPGEAEFTFRIVADQK